MKGIRRIAFTALLAALAGCATPYQPTGTAGGYYHKVLAENTYLVGFSGNGFTDRSTARDFALLRAAEIGKQLRYDHMVILGKDDKSRTEDVKFGAPTATTYGTVTGNSYNATTTYNSNEVPVFKPKVEYSVLYSEGYPPGRHLEVFRIADLIRDLKARHAIDVATGTPKPTGVNFDTAINTAVKSSRTEFWQWSNWLPNQFGYKGQIRTKPRPPNSGALVLTPEAVLFLIWSEASSRFITAKVIPRESIQEVTVAKSGLGRRLVLVSSDGVNSFELLGKSRVMIDRKATKKVAGLLNNSGRMNDDSGKSDIYANLEKLNDLREQGILTDAEFDFAKKRILAAQ